MKRKGWDYLVKSCVKDTDIEVSGCCSYELRYCRVLIGDDYDHGLATDRSVASLE
jgi:hypothetical protein